MILFDRRALRKQRDHVAAGFAEYDFLVREAADRLTERLDDMARSFPMALDLGCHTGQVADMLGKRGGIETLVQSDLSPAMAARAAGANGRAALAADEEWLPFAPASFDLVLSCLSLHWVNDLPGTLVQIRRMLKPDGLFLAVMPGLGTLVELRRALAEADREVGDAEPRVSPFVDIRDLAGLLQRAGFVGPVVDGDRMVIRYAEPLRLFADLRGMGETNLTVARRRAPTRRTILFDALARYSQDHADADNRLPATIELLTMTAWAG